MPGFLANTISKCQFGKKIKAKFESLLCSFHERLLLRNERGMALLVTVMVLSLIFAVTVQYHKSTWHKYAVSYNHKTGIQLRAIASSGIEIATELLDIDRKTSHYNSLLDTWANIDNDAFRQMFPLGTLQLSITDLSGRLQINSLVQKKNENNSKKEKEGGVTTPEQEIREVFFRLLLSGMFPVEDELQAKHIVDSLVDWIDEDNNESDHGAENSYYRSLDQPYNCKNGSVEYVEELLLVSGITPQLLFGSTGRPGLADFITVHGTDGKININTAPLLLIKCFDSLIDDDLLKRLDDFRKDKDGKEKLSHTAWYKNVSGWPGDIVLDERILSIKSKYFQVSSIGKADTMAKQTTGVLERSNNGKFKQLFRRVN